MKYFIGALIASYVVMFSLVGYSIYNTVTSRWAIENAEARDYTVLVYTSDGKLFREFDISSTTYPSIYRPSGKYSADKLNIKYFDKSTKQFRFVEFPTVFHAEVKK